MNVAVFFDDPGFDDYPFSKEEYKESYHHLAELVHVRGSTLWIVRNQSSYRGGLSFQGAWKYENGSFNRTEDIVIVDRIFNRKHFRGDPGIDVINDPALESFCNDKWRTYQAFSSLCPETCRAESKLSAQRFLDQVDQDTIVAKPIDGEEGVGVYIGSKADVLQKVDTYPYLFQKFIDSSRGIPGIVHSTHDLRMVLINGEIALSFVRTPPSGGLLANVAQGGEIVPVSTADLPMEARRIAKAVEKSPFISLYKPSIYSVDVALDSDHRFKIIELNAKPALFGKHRGADFATMQEKLADTLIAP